MARTTGGRIEVAEVTKRYGSDPLALDGVSLTVEPGEFVSIVGRSGCGKTTLLNLIAGFTPPTTGRITVNDHLVSRPGPDRGMVFQESALFPWLTARRNVEFGPRSQGASAAEARAAAAKLIELVGMSGFEDKYPRELSGGMAQRIAIARALATDPTTLLMDEPFGALDELTRSTMQDELLNIWYASAKTVLLVTHSIPEAIYLADRIVVMTPHPGQISEVFEISMERPRDRFSPEFTSTYQKINDAIF